MSISWKDGVLSRDDEIGPKADAAASTDTGAFSLVSLFKRLLQKITAGLPIAGADGLTPASAANPVPVSTSAARPESAALTRPNDTTAYAQNDIIANSTTAGSVAYPTIAVGAAAGRPVRVWRLRLRSSVTSGWGSTLFRVRLWSGPPTYTNGDNGAYSVATGNANLIGRATIELVQNGDGAVGFGVLEVGAFAQFVPTGSLLYWDLQYIGSAALTPVANQTFNLAVEVEQL